MNSKIYLRTGISSLEHFVHEFVSRSPVILLALSIAIFRNIAFCTFFKSLVVLSAAPTDLIHNLRDAGYLHAQLSLDPMSHELIIHQGPDAKFTVPDGAR